MSGAAASATTIWIPEVQRPPEGRHCTDDQAGRVRGRRCPRFGWWPMGHGSFGWSYCILYSMRCSRKSSRDLCNHIIRRDMALRCRSMSWTSAEESGGPRLRWSAATTPGEYGLHAYNPCVARLSDSRLPSCAECWKWTAKWLDTTCISFRPNEQCQAALLVRRQGSTYLHGVIGLSRAETQSTVRSAFLQTCGCT